MDHVSIHFNHRVASAFHLTPKQIKNLSKVFEAVSVKDFLNDRAKFIPEWVMLKGKNQEIAYIDTLYENSATRDMGDEKHKIVFEFPLSLTVDKIRAFTETALRLFKNKFESENEISFDGTFKVITKRPYTESEHSFGKRLVKFRWRSCADKKPHGSLSKRPDYLKKRNEWIRDQYNIHIKAGLSSDTAYEKIQDALDLLPLPCFGEWPQKVRGSYKGTLKPKGKSPLDISPETIKDIIQRKS